MDKEILFRIETPRGAINVHTVFDSIEEAEKEGWGLWFQHEGYFILARDNRAGSVVQLTRVGNRWE